MSGATESKRVRVAVVGTGEFGRNHARVYRELESAELIGVYDQNPERAAAVGTEFQAPVLHRLEELQGKADAVSVAVPTVAHSEVGCRLLEMGLDVLVEKPMAVNLREADELLEAARKYRRILQVGHVERFNPAVLAVQLILNRPLFFEVHRLGVFTPRSLDVDVIYDLMIHDLDILLALVNEPVTEVKAVGIPVLTDKVDIAHARLEFAGGAVANVTASRVSTERVRKMRFFQQHEYVSLDYGRRDALRIYVKKAGPQPEFGFEKLTATAAEPLRTELEAFVTAVRTGKEPCTNGAAGRAALELASRVMASIQEHDARVQPVAAVSGNEPTR
ncbi:MAG TPA: Gfo/Idh/MocA family oxidoreductase [Candidatus Acidoferrum sp.]|nr:Gfo/Idh/MocA family oxidoreductase [Methylomirabilota bacterium]HUK30811.1 Gfo/Idh/MocA family oxidoreductase [Candidatus Acidoferrum sp.]